MVGVPFRFIFSILFPNFNLPGGKESGKFATAIWLDGLLQVYFFHYMGIPYVTPSRDLVT